MIMKKICTDLKDYIMESEFCIHVFSDRVNVVNYTGMYGFDSDSIVVKHKNGTVLIKGDSLSLSKLLDSEILIGGNIKQIEFRWYMVILKVSGRLIKKFIKKLCDNGINLYKIKEIDKSEVYIYISKTDLDKVLELGIIYDIEVVGHTGYLQFLNLIKKNIFVIISFIISIIFVIFLSNLVFEINIVSNNTNIRNILIEELKNEGIYKYSIKKNYEDLSLIKENLLNKYSDILEWVEIEHVGVRCIVRIEERIVSNIEESNEKYHIVALKDAVIKDVKASHGDIVKGINKAVKKGDIIISGSIYLNEELKENIGARGKVMGEVWYNVEVSYPLTYYEETINGAGKIRYSFKLFNKEINLFRKDGKIIKEKLFESKYFSLFKNTIYDVKVIDEVYNYDEAIKLAQEKARKQMESKLDKDEYIIHEKSLKVSLNDSKIVLDMFYSVYEDITGYERIDIND